MNAPQIIVISLFVMNVTMTLCNHGKPAGNHNAIAATIGTAVMAALLFWGGFWG